MIPIDPAQLAAFAEAMFRHADEGTWVSLRTFREDLPEKPVSIEAVRLNGDPGVIAAAASAEARSAASYRRPTVFCPPIASFVVKDKADEASLANGLALTVELDANAEAGRKRLEFLFNVPATVVVASGGIWDCPETGESQPKLHLHWRLKEPTRTPEAHARLKKARAMATAVVGGDPSSVPICHPIRWPGSVHRKGEPTLCEIVAINPDSEIELQDALSILFDIQPEFRKEGPAAGKPPGEGEDRDTAELIRALLAGEDYHSTLLALSMRYLKRGMAPDQVVLSLKGMMEAIPHERRDGATPGRWQARLNDIARTVREGQTKLEQQTEAAAPDQAAAPSDLILLDQCKLDTEVFWTIEDILPRFSMVMIYARGGSGKTYLMTSVALGIATGKWFGHEIECGAVLICAFERDQDAEDRLAALRDRYGYKAAPIGLLKLGGKRLDRPTAELIVKSAAALSAQAGLPVRGIVIDTVSRALAGGKEDDEGFGRLASFGEMIHAATKATIFWVHHEGKGDSMGPRGHLVLPDACSCWWHVEERENGVRVVHVAKANRGPAYMPLFAFTLVPFEAGKDRRGKAIKLCEVQQVELEPALANRVLKRFGEAKANPEAGLGKRQRVMLSQLRKLGERHPDGVERSMLKSHFLLALPKRSEPLDPETASALFRQVLSSLRRRGFVREEGDLIILADADDPA